MQDNRPAVYLEDTDKVIYRASSLGHCLRELWAARTGLEARPIPETIQKAMDEGTNLESTILDLLYINHNFTFGYNSHQFQVELNVGTWNGKTLIVRGKVDEVGGPSDTPLMLPIDVKAFGQSLVDDYRAGGLSAFPRYAWQQSVYMEGYGTNTGYMPIYNKDTQKIEPWSLEPIRQIYTREQIRDRVLQVEEYAESGTMPEQCPGTYGCVYYYLHDQKDTETLPENAVQLVTARIKLSNKIKTLDAARKALDGAISPRLQQDITYRIDNYDVIVFANPARFNTAAAKRLLSDAEVEWENDPEFWIPGKGTQIRMTPKKRPLPKGTNQQPAKEEP
jgi:hypothetical protein